MEVILSQKICLKPKLQNHLNQIGNHIQLKVTKIESIFSFL